MVDVDFEKLQSEIIKPQGLCINCAFCTDTNKDTCIASRTTSIWAEYPELCEYSGWVFKEREYQKHLVRKVKEEIMVLSVLLNIIEEKKQLSQRLETLKEQIRPWEKYGGDSW